MKMEELETALAEYAKRIKTLERELAKQRAVTEIQNLVGRYVYLHTGGKHTKCVDLFSTREDTSVEIGPMGVFCGPKGVHQCYAVNHNVNEGARIGFLAIHPLTTPVIEVADDLQTAQGLWIHNGCETMPQPDGAMEPNWMTGNYAIDFIQENGVWKMWHFHMFPIFSCPFDKPWTQVEPLDRIMFERGEARDGFNRMQKGADHPTTYMREYSADRPTLYWPQPPEPYATFSGTRSMVGAPPENADL